MTHFLSAVIFLITNVILTPALANEANEISEQDGSIGQGVTEIFLGGAVVHVDDFDENAISPLVILEHWPICEIPSSLGQICKLFEDLERPVKWVDLFGWMGFDRRPIILNLMNTEITITAPEFWHFTYKIEPGPEGIWKVFFISDSIGGSLLTLTEYEVTIQPGEMSVRELSTVDWRYLLNTNSPIPRSDLLSEHMSRAQ